MPRSRRILAKSGVLPNRLIRRAVATVRVLRSRTYRGDGVPHRVSGTYAFHKESPTYLTFIRSS